MKVTHVPMEASVIMETMHSIVSVDQDGWVIHVWKVTILVSQFFVLFCLFVCSFVCFPLSF